MGAGGAAGREEGRDQNVPGPDSGVWTRCRAIDVHTEIGRLQSLYPLDRGGLSRGTAVPAGLYPARISIPCRGYLERPVARD